MCDEAMLISHGREERGWYRRVISDAVEFLDMGRYLIHNFG